MTAPQRFRRAFWSYSLFLITLCGIAAVWQAAEIPSRHAVAQEVAPTKRAILVGINGYDHPKLTALKFAENDARDMADVLTAQGYTVDVLTGAKATKAGVEAALKRVIAGCKKGDAVLVGLAGHGLQFLGQADCYFVPVDGVPFKDRTASLVSLNAVYEQLDQSFAGIKVLLVDACRDDPSTTRGIDADTAPRPPQGVAALFSCKAGERAFEHKDLGHGVFFHFVLEGLKGKAKDEDGEVTFAGLTAYVSKNVSRTVPKLIAGGAEQSPTLQAKYSREPILAKLDLRPVTPPKSEGLTVAPFDATRPRTAAEAKGAQETWATKLGVKVDYENSFGMKFRLLPPGEFLMGSPEDDKDAQSNEKPQKRVTLSSAVYMGQHEVTVGQFLKFYHAAKYKCECERDGKGGWGYDSKGAYSQKPEYMPWSWGHSAQTMDHPVVNITWNDAVAFSEWLSKEDKRTYRLPTEAEWEYACRAGTTSRYWMGDDAEELAKVGNVADGTAKLTFKDWSTIAAKDGYESTAPVGKFRANPFGLYDMHGNVWEWCGDWYDTKLAGGRDPRGPSEGSDRVNRGGSWGSPAGRCRSAIRYGDDPSSRGGPLGFRLSLSPSE